MAPARREPHPRLQGSHDRPVNPSLIPGLMSLAAYEWGFSWEWVALLAVTALATVGVVWLVIRWQPSVPFMELVLCQMVAVVGTIMQSPSRPGLQRWQPS